MSRGSLCELSFGKVKEGKSKINSADLFRARPAIFDETEGISIEGIF